MRFPLRLPMVLGMFVVLLPLARSVQPVRAADERCFAETKQCIDGRFRAYWEQHGGLPVFGFPISAARPELNPDTGGTYLTQWFERNRFELHPEHRAPYDVLLGRLGDDRLRQQHINWQDLPREPGPKPDCLWFQETGHNVCNDAPSFDEGFKTYWQTHGVQDPRLDGYGKSLALFGLPLTEPRRETNANGDTVWTQWFERARFEWHPDNRAGFKVLLGLLGNELQPGVGSHPSIFYIHRDTIYELSFDGMAKARAGIANMGRVLDVLNRGGTAAALHLLCEQGLQRVVPSGAGKEIARFAKGAALFGHLLPIVQTPQIIYAYARQVDLPPFNREGVVGLLDMDDDTARKVLSAPNGVSALGLTHDSRGIYVIRVGQDPSFTEVEVVAVDGGAVLKRIPVTGEGAAALSPDRRTLAVVGARANGERFLQVIALSDSSTGRRTIEIPRRGWTINRIIWATDSQVAYATLYPMSGSGGSGALARIEVQTGATSILTSTIPEDTQLLGIDEAGRWLLTQDTTTSVRVIDLTNGRTVSHTVPAGAAVSRWY